jgi:hypothetical protein
MVDQGQDKGIGMGYGKDGQLVASGDGKDHAIAAL